MRILFGLISMLALSACSTARVIDDMNYSLTDIQKAVGEIFPGGILGMSSNQRELTSAIFAVRRPSGTLTPFNSLVFAKDKPEYRYKAKAIILGDRRPYSLEVGVDQERLDEKTGTYSSEGTSAAMSDRLAFEIRKYLVQRSEKKNVIDDFRAF